MIKYVKCNNSLIGKGFITYAESEKIKFNMIPMGDNNAYIKLDGLEIDINAWISKVKGIEITGQEFVNNTHPINDPERRLDNIEARLTILETK